MKPDWKDAPEKAKWLAMDECGKWYWHFKKPTLSLTRFGYYWESGERSHAPVDHTNTLEKRPVSYTCTLKKRPAKSKEAT